MVLQRGKPDTIWGWSDPGDTVRVQIGESTAIGTAGPDRRWQVQIQPPAPGGPYTDGANVVVSSSSVPNPTQVRYAWQSNPAATLFNGAGLPAGPFRTDTWSGKTEGHRPY